MKIGILTLVGSNYGNRLQNYALQEYLKSLDSSIEVATFQRNYARNLFLASVKKKIKNKKSPDDVFLMKIKEVFQQFNNEYVQFTDEIVYKCYDNTKLNERYDYFITGSDQVWNPYYTLTSKNDFIMFADHEKRISYAASIGVAEIPEKRKEEYMACLQGMHAISVREEAAKRLIQKLTKKEAQVHVDPTMLLCTEKWESIEKVPNWYKGGSFILSYILGDMTNSIQYELDEASKTYDAPIVHVFNRKQTLDYIHDPSQFLWLIHHAQCVYTDSFHCTLFALLYGKDFVVFRRKGEESKSGSRIDTLLRTFDLYEDFDTLLKISTYDRNMIHMKLETEQKRSETYLKQALRID